MGYADCPPLDVPAVAAAAAAPTTRCRRHREASHQPTLDFILLTAESGPDTIVASACTGWLRARRRRPARRSPGQNPQISLQRDELVALMAERGEPFTLVPEWLLMYVTCDSKTQLEPKTFFFFAETKNCELLNRVYNAGTVAA